MSNSKIHIVGWDIGCDDIYMNKNNKRISFTSKCKHVCNKLLTFSTADIIILQNVSVKIYTIVKSTLSEMNYVFVSTHYNTHGVPNSTGVGIAYKIGVTVLETHIKCIIPKKIQIHNKSWITWLFGHRIPEMYNRALTMHLLVGTQNIVISTYISTDVTHFDAFLEYTHTLRKTLPICIYTNYNSNSYDKLTMFNMEHCYDDIITGPRFAIGNNMICVLSETESITTKLYNNIDISSYLYQTIHVITINL